jgi:phage head maturation protease
MKPVEFAGYGLHWNLPGKLLDQGTRLLVPHPGNIDLTEDVPVCAGHDERTEYARASERTLSMWEDAFGVAVSFTITDYGLANAICSGATCGLSFTYLLECTHTEERTCGKVEIVDRAGIRELSVVTEPKMLGAYCWRKDWDTLSELPPETRHYAVAWLEGLREIREKSDNPSSRRSPPRSVARGLSGYHHHHSLGCLS